MSPPKVAILGAHTLVGEACAEALEGRASLVRLSPLEDVSDGVDLIKAEALEGAALAVLAADHPSIRAAAASARERGAIAIDLVGAIPGARAVRPFGELPALEPGGAYALAAGLAAPIASALSALADFSPRLAVITTFESAAIAGRAGVDALGDQVRRLLAFGDAEPGALPDRLAFNVLPDVGLGAGSAAAEAALAAELRAALGPKAPILRVSRQLVPCFTTEGCAVELVVEGTPALAAVEGALAAAQGARFGRADEPTLADASDRDHALIGRLRVAPGRIAFWLAADRLRVGVGAQLLRLVDRAFAAG